MQAGQLTYAKSNVGNFDASSVSEKVGGWVARLFGCWHTEMSRPFSHQGQAYRTCLSCGAQRKFNLGNWETQGDFYYRLPSTTHFRVLNGLATIR
jgi:hypothetical protein